MASAQRVVLPATLSALLTIAVVGGAGASNAAPGSGLKCAKTATIVKHLGSGSITYYDQQDPGGAKLHGKTLTRAHAYVLNGGRVTLRFGTDTFVVSDHSIIALSCSGDAAGDPASMPMLRMLTGSAKVHTTKTKHGSVATEEGLFGMVAGKTNPLVFIVTRTTQKAHMSSNDIAKWFINYNGQPNGTSTAKTTNRPSLNVTPYVGPSPGTCRSVRSAKLVTTGKYGHGTATYHSH